MTPYNVMAKDLVTMIVEIGVPSTEIGLAAAQAHLATPTQFTTVWGQNWAWDKTALTKLPEQRLVSLLDSLRETVGFQ